MCQFAKQRHSTTRCLVSSIIEDCNSSAVIFRVLCNHAVLYDASIVRNMNIRSTFQIIYYFYTAWFQFTEFQEWTISVEKYYLVSSDRIYEI